MKLGNLDIKKAYLGGFPLTSENAFIGTTALLPVAPVPTDYATVKVLRSDTLVEHYNIDTNHTDYSAHNLYSPILVKFARPSGSPSITFGIENLTSSIMFGLMLHGYREESTRWLKVYINGSSEYRQADVYQRSGMSTYFNTTYPYSIKQKTTDYVLLMILDPGTTEVKVELSDTYSSYSYPDCMASVLFGNAQEIHFEGLD